MPDFDKLKEHAERLNKLLEDRQEGLSSWCVAVRDNWKAIADMYYGNRKE